MVEVPNRGARRPGSRETSGWNRKNSEDRPRPNRVAWTHMPRFDLILTQRDAAPDEDYPSIAFEIRPPGRKSEVWMSLTYLTLDELTVFKEFFDYAYEKARPICEAIDRKAQEAWDNGEFEQDRLYRKVPELIIIERIKREHDQSVSSRPEDAEPGVPVYPNGARTVGDGGESALEQSANDDGSDDGQEEAGLLP